MNKQRRCHPTLPDLSYQEEEEEEESHIKVLLIGRCGVGKSSLLHRLIEGCHNPSIKPTHCGIDYKLKHHTLPGMMSIA